MFLKNNGKQSKITLRYGVGLRQVLSIESGKVVELPLQFPTDLAKKYVATFNDLEVVSGPEATTAEDEIVEDNEQPQDKDPVGSTNENPVPNGEVVSGSTEEGGSNEESSTEDKDPEEQKDPEDSNDKNENESGSGEDNNNQSGSDEGNEQPKDLEESEVVYTEAQLKNMKADEVKALAASLGIDTSDESSNTKKELIAIILKQQESQE